MDTMQMRQIENNTAHMVDFAMKIEIKQYDLYLEMINDTIQIGNAR
jgi:hypothetical protein